MKIEITEEEIHGVTAFLNMARQKAPRGSNSRQILTELVDKFDEDISNNMSQDDSISYLKKLQKRLAS